MSEATQSGDDVATALARLAREIESGDLELPLLPRVAAEVLTSSVDEAVDAARLAELIQQDQSLASHVLRIVNSPAFRGAVEIVALRQAIARLGMERIREISLSASMKSTLLTPGPYSRLADASWRSALAAGLWSKELARATRRNVEIAYLCGLLHNIGVPLLLQRLGELAPDLPSSEVERLLERLSRKAGARLATEWSLPAVVASTIRHLHAFEQAGAECDTVAVAAAGVHCAEVCGGEQVDLQAVTACPALRHLNLYPEDIEQLLEQRETINAAVESMSL